MGSIPGQGTKILRATQHSQKNYKLNVIIYLTWQKNYSLTNKMSFKICFLINICSFLQVAQHYRSIELHWIYGLEQLLSLNSGVSFFKHSFFSIHKNYNYAISWTEILLELNHIILLLYNPLAFQLSCKVHTSWFRIELWIISG